jgi:hypothetical protein
MRQDSLLALSDAQAVTASAASESVIDQLAEGQAIGHECWLEVRVDTTVESGGASTLVISIETDSAEGFGTKSTLVASRTIAKADLVENTIAWRIKLPPGAKRYLRAYYTVATANFTAGKFDAHLVTGVEIRP